MADYRIKCEVVKISDNESVCPDSSQAKMGEVFTLGGKTPGGHVRKGIRSNSPDGNAYATLRGNPLGTGARVFRYNVSRHLCGLPALTLQRGVTWTAIQ